MGGEEPRSPPIYTHALHSPYRQYQASEWRRTRKSNLIDSRSLRFRRYKLIAIVWGWRSRSVQLLKPIIPMLARLARRSAELALVMPIHVSDSTLTTESMHVHSVCVSLAGFVAGASAAPSLLLLRLRDHMHPCPGIKRPDGDAIIVCGAPRPSADGAMKSAPRGFAKGRDSGANV